MNDPVTKLVPIIKLIGKLTVSFTSKLTFFLSELFCIETTKNKNKHILNKVLNKIFLSVNNF